MARENGPREYGRRIIQLWLGILVIAAAVCGGLVLALPVHAHHVPTIGADVGCGTLLLHGHDTGTSAVAPVLKTDVEIT